MVTQRSSRRRFTFPSDEAGAKAGGITFEQMVADARAYREAAFTNEVSAQQLAQAEKPTPVESTLALPLPKAAQSKAPTGLRAISDALSRVVSAPIQKAAELEQKTFSGTSLRGNQYQGTGPINLALKGLGAVNQATLPVQGALLWGALKAIPGVQPGEKALEAAYGPGSSLAKIETAKAETKFPFGVVGGIELATNPLTYLGGGGAKAALAKKGAAKTAEAKLAEETATTKAAAEAPVATGPMAAKAAEPVASKAAETISAELPSAAGQGLPPPRPAASPASEPGFAANIRLSKFSEDARPIIKAWADANPDAVQAARRGVRSDAQVIEDARALVNDLGGNFEKMVKQWKPGQAWNAEEITAVRGALEDATGELVNVQAAIRAGVDTSENQLRLVNSIYKEAQLQQVVHGLAAEQGRSLRAFRQQATEALQNGDTVRMAALLKKLEGKGTPEQIAAELAKIDINNPVQLSSLIRGFTKPRGWEYGLEVVINAYLSSPTSHIINNLSNAAMVGISPVRRALAATIEAGVAPLQGRARQRFFSEVPADVIGAVQGIPEGLRSFLYVMRNGTSPEAALKYELPRTTAFTGRIGRFVNLPSQLMQAADQLYYQINYRAALNAEAIRIARLSPKAGMGQVERAAELIANPSSELIAKAAKIAEYNLFREEAGSGTKWLLAGRDEMLVVGGVPVLRFLIPFVRTPANLLKVGLGHSPVGFANLKMWGELMRKDPAFADKMGSAILGTAVASTIALGFAKGQITGATPTNAAERDKFFRDGKLPYSVKMGNAWIPYNRLSPFDMAINLVGSTIQAQQLGDDATALAKAGVVVTMLGKKFTDMPYMTGLSTIMDALDSPTDKGAVFAERFLAGGIPYSGLLRQTATTLDPTYRKPEGLVQQVQAEIPGQTQNVPPRLNVFGEQPQRTSPSISPLAWSPADVSPLEAELTRLKVNIGFVGTTFGGVKLSKSQQAAYQTLAGQTAKANLIQVIDMPQYRALDDVTKQDVLEAIQKAANEQARYVLKINKQPQPGVNSRPLRILERIAMTQSPLVKVYQEAGDAVLRAGGQEAMIEAYHDYLKADNLTQAAIDKQNRNLFKQTASAESRVKAKMRQQNALLDGYYVRYADGTPNNDMTKKRYQDILATDTFLDDMLVR